MNGCVLTLCSDLNCAGLGMVSPNPSFTSMLTVYSLAGIVGEIFSLGGLFKSLLLWVKT